MGCLFTQEGLHRSANTGYNNRSLEQQTDYRFTGVGPKQKGDEQNAMNIYYFDHYAGSYLHGMEFRPFLMAKRWVQAGHKVTIVASSFSHLRGQNPDLMGQKTYSEEIDGVRFFWIRGNHYSGNGMDRVRNILSFVRGLYHWQNEFIGKDKPDVIIASSTYPMDIYPAVSIAKKYNAKVIFEVHDLWPQSPMELGKMSKLHPFIQVTQRAENYAYQNSDYVVSLLPNAKEHMLEHGMKPEQYVYVPNGVEASDWKEPDDLEDAVYYDLLHQFHEEGYFLVGYAGAHGLANALDSFVEAGSKLKGEKVKLILVGQGPEKTRLQQKINDLGLRDTVETLEAVKRSQIPGLLAQFDALYIGTQRKPVFQYGISPNKLFDYMMAAKPIIYAIEYDKNAVEKSGCGITIRAERSAAIARAAVQLSQKSPEERRKMGQRGKEYVLQNHEYGVLADRFLEVLERPKRLPAKKASDEKAGDSSKR